MSIHKGMYGLPQAGILANKLLKKRLARYGYFEMPHTPGLWRHISRPIAFTLVVDDFGIKYQGIEHAHHLLNAIKADYQVEVDWDGGLYCGIELKWNYKKGYVDIAMPGYVKNSRVIHTPTPNAGRTPPSIQPPENIGRWPRTSHLKTISPSLHKKDKAGGQQLPLLRP